MNLAKPNQGGKVFKIAAFILDLNQRIHHPPAEDPEIGGLGLKGISQDATGQRIKNFSQGGFHPGIPTSVRRFGNDHVIPGSRLLDQPGDQLRWIAKEIHNNHVVPNAVIQRGRQGDFFVIRL